MKTRTTLILVILALVIGGVVALDYFKGTPTEQAETRRKRVFHFEAKDVSSLKIELTNRVFELEKSGEEWRIEQPLRARASASAVNSILDELEFADRTRTLTEQELRGMSLAEFGLATPRVRATLRTKTGPIQFVVGNDTPTKDALYIQLQGSKNVVVAPSTIYQRLDRTLDDLRDRLVMDFQPAAATRFEIRSADRVIEVVKSASGANAEPRWALTRPLAARADQRKVNGLLSDLNGLRILDFVSEDPKDLHTYQLDEPERELTVWSGESGKTLLLGRAVTNNPNRVYAKLKSADSIFTVSAASGQRFAVQANDLRDARVLTFAEDDVRGVDLIRGTERISLTRTDSTWTITAPTPVAAEDSAVQTLLGHLKTLSAKQFTADVATDLDKYGLAAASVTVSLHNGGTNILTQLLVGAEDASNAVRFVKRADEPFVYGVDTNLDAWLPPSYLALRSRRVADLKAEQIDTLTVESAAARVVVERGPDKTWRLVEPSEGVLDNDALQQVIGGLGQLRAEEFVQEGRGNLVAYGLDQPQRVLTMGVGERNYRLALGKLQGSDRRYALWSDPPLVFTMWTSLANTLAKDFVKLPAAGSPPAATPTNAPPPSEPAPTNAPAEKPSTATLNDLPTP
jgi:hypothetical protein